MGKYPCEHNKNKYICLICNPNKDIKKYTCPHGKQCKSRCNECLGHPINTGKCSRCKKPYESDVKLSNGKLLQTCPKCRVETCPHDNRLKSTCKECKKEYRRQNVCSHNKRKNRCKECTNNTEKKFKCSHDRQWGCCSICKIGYCEHDIRKSVCKLCNGSSICIHNLNKQYCKTCGGSALCKNEWCETKANSKYKKYCLFCFIEKFPNEKVARNYKIKEKHVVDCVLEKFPNFTWYHDKKIQDGCSLRRPDLYLDYGSHVIMIEIDENQHKSYDCSCITKRICELSLDINERPCVMINFNPDGYVDEKQNIVRTPWKIHKNTGVLSIMKTSEKEWNERITNLLDCIEYWIKNPSDKMIEIIELYYDM